MWIFDPETGQLKEQDEAPAVDLSGSGGVPTGAGPPAALPAPTSSGNFTDMNKYLQLNQPQSEALGEKVAGGIEQTTNEASQALDKGQQEFNDLIAAQTPSISGEQAKNLASYPSGLTSFVQDPNNVESFKKAAAGQYTGPKDLSSVAGYQDLIGHIEKAAKAGELAKTSGGRQELIKNVYTKPERAKQGMLSLDESLVKQTPAAIGKIEEKAKAAAPLADRSKEIQENAAQAAQAKQAEVSKTSEDIRNAFLGEGGAYEKLKSGLDSRVQDISAKSESAASQARNYLDKDFLKNAGIITEVQPPTPAGFVPGYVMPKQIKVNWDKVRSIPPEVLDQLDISATDFGTMLANWATPGPSGFGNAIDPQWQSVNFGDYASFGSPTSAGIDRGSVATDEERATLDALGKLFGEVDTSFIPKSDKKYSGTADLTEFRYQDLLNYLRNPRYLPVGVRGA